MDNSSKLFVESLKNARFAVVLTGAGVSVASGIPDFRSNNGLFSKISQETFEIGFLMSQPAEYYKIAQKYIHPLADKEPNVTHRMLAELERGGLLKTVITQNIDRLHQKAGSENVIEFHGNVVAFHCTQCQREYNKTQVDEKINDSGIPKCDSCDALIRPDIVFYGDMIPEYAIRTSQELCCKCDLFIAMGTSLNVNPAADLTQIASNNGAKVIIVTKGRTLYDRIAHHKFDDDLEQFSNAVIQQLQS